MGSCGEINKKNWQHHFHLICLITYYSHGTIYFEFYFYTFKLCISIIIVHFIATCHLIFICWTRKIVVLRDKNTHNLNKERKKMINNQENNK